MTRGVVRLAAGEQDPPELGVDGRRGELDPRSRMGAPSPVRSTSTPPRLLGRMPPSTMLSAAATRYGPSLRNATKSGPTTTGGTQRVRQQHHREREPRT
jgi:hypothetical protein